MSFRFRGSARRRGAVLASLRGHALEIEVSTSEASRGLDLAVSDVSDAVAPELVAKALVAAWGSPGCSLSNFAFAKTFIE